MSNTRSLQKQVGTHVTGKKPDLINAVRRVCKGEGVVKEQKSPLITRRKIERISSVLQPRFVT